MSGGGVGDSLLSTFRRHVPCPSVLVSVEGSRDRYFGGGEGPLVREGFDSRRVR